MSKAVGHIQKIGRHDELETPPELFKRICRESGITPKIDVAATRANAKCDHFFSLEVEGDHQGSDALMEPWDDDFWCNPPYTRVGHFAAKAVYEVAEHGVSGILLTYAKTDTRWFHDHIWQKPGIEVHFIRGRVRFLKPDGTASGPASYPSCWIVMRPPEVP